MHSAWPSLRQTIRSLTRSSSFSLAVIGCLALGLTANASVLTMLNAVVMRPLPYGQPHELLHLGLGDGAVANLPVPGAEYLQWLQANQSLAGAATYHQTRALAGTDGAMEDLLGAAVSISFADVLGVRPALGRFLSADDERLAGQGSVVLGNQLWLNRFGGDSGIIGRSIRMNDRNATVVGVMPARFEFPHGSQFWQAAPLPTGAPGEYYTIVARRRAAVSVDAVRADLIRIPRPSIANLPRTMVDARPTVEVLRDRLYGSAEPALMMLFAAATLLLIIGGIGVANLVLARNTSRGHEFALRLALGGSRIRVMTPVIMECVLLAAIAGAIGLIFSAWVTQLFVHIGPPILEQVNNIGLDWRVVSIMALWTIGTGAAIGIGAALQATGRRVVAGNALKGRVSRTGRLSNVTRRVLVVAQIAVSMLLITGAGLLAISLARVTSIPLGFNAENVVLATVRAPRERYQTAESVRELFEAMRQALKNTAGVVSVTYGPPPMSGFDEMLTSPTDDAGRSYSLASSAVGPEFFKTHRIPITIGRDIGERDNASSEPVVVINQSAKEMIFPDRSPLGEQLTAMTVRGRHPTIIGVTSDVPQYDIAMPAQPAAFAAMAQVDGRPTELTIRTLDGSATLVDDIRAVIKRHDANLAGRFSLMEDAVQRSLSPRLFTATLAGAFAVLALVISTVGLLGLLTCMANQRAHEMGIRVALGAGRGDIIKLMLREGVVLTAAGLTLGVMLTLALNGMLASLIFQLAPRDPYVLFGSAATVGAITLAATLVPAVRASSAHPMRALRQD